MLQNLHTHCTFCDGKDTPEQMVQRAVELGFDSLGFSSHAMTDAHTQYELKDVEGYKTEINRLKEKYAGKIEIFLGCELDYYSAGIMPTDGFEYTIGSVHVTKLPDGRSVTYDECYEWAKEYVEDYFGGDSLAYARLYFDTVADLPNRLGNFDIVGHFDLLTKYSEEHPELIDLDSKKYKSIALEALHALREKKEIFEVNTGAIGRGYRTTPYPAPFILDEMKRLDCKIVLTSDCHNRDFLDCNFKESYEYIRAHGFEEISYLTSNHGVLGHKI